jgi:hypothetical protein
MSGRHDRTNAGSRVRASRSGVPAEGTDPRSAAAGQPAPGQPAPGQHGPSQYAPDQNASGQHGPGRSDMSRNDAGRNGMSRGGAGQGGVSRAGAGDGVGMTDRSDAGASGGGDREPDPASDGPTIPMEAVARRTPTGWRVGDEEVPDLTSAMVLADLLAAELSAEEQAELDAGAAAPPPAVPRDAATHNTGQLGGVATPARPAARTTAAGTGAADAPTRGPAPGPGAHRSEETPFGAADAAQLREAEQLKETVAQLERALTVRVRVEQAIGILAERHRIRPRQAFELLRSASRARGQRIMETAGQVIASATNPLLRLPEELAKPPMPRRMPRRSRGEA